MQHACGLRRLLPSAVRGTISDGVCLLCGGSSGSRPAIDGIEKPVFAPGRQSGSIYELWSCCRWLLIIVRELRVAEQDAHHSQHLSFLAHHLAVMLPTAAFKHLPEAYHTVPFI